jgi:hypothetical protein
MEDRTVNEETLKFIRHITSDGIVEKDEVWDLGRFLKSDRTARGEWPGNVLWEILGEIFADDVVSDEEAADLTTRMREIEKECHDRTTDAGGEKVEPDELYEEIDLELPAVDLQMEIEPHRPGDAPAKVDLSGRTCSCPDWAENRKDFAPDSVGRLCRCMATAYERALNGMPDLYEKLGPHMVNLIRLLSTYGLGGVAEDKWRLLEGGNFHHFVSWDDSDWVSIFSENEDGLFERFGYNRKERRWLYGVKPVGAGTILHFLAHRH